MELVLAEAREYTGVLNFCNSKTKSRVFSTHTHYCLYANNKYIVYKVREVQIRSLQPQSEDTLMDFAAIYIKCPMLAELKVFKYGFERKFFFYDILRQNY